MNKIFEYIFYHNDEFSRDFGHTMPRKFFMLIFKIQRYIKNIINEIRIFWNIHKDINFLFYLLISFTLLISYFLIKNIIDYGVFKYFFSMWNTLMVGLFYYILFSYYKERKKCKNISYIFKEIINTKEDIKETFLKYGLNIDDEHEWERNISLIFKKETEAEKTFLYKSYCGLSGVILIDHKQYLNNKLKYIKYNINNILKNQYNKNYVNEEILNNLKDINKNCNICIHNKLLEYHCDTQEIYALNDIFYLIEKKLKSYYNKFFINLNDNNYYI